MSSDTLMMNGATSNNGNASLLNGTTNLDYSEPSTSQEPVAITTSTIEQTYDSLFPALPEGSNTQIGRTANFAQWSTPSSLSNGSDLAASNGHSGKIMKVRSSRVTEHFTILSEEKRDTRKICADIARETSTDIEMTNTSKGLTFLITGKNDKVREAKKRISAELTVPSVYELEVPKEAYGSILGKSGNRLKDLEQRSGARITLPKTDSTDLIKIKGSGEAISQAIHEIQLISAEALSKCKEVISIEREYHAFISGPFNETLNQLQQETGAKINIPPFTFNKSDIVITGDQNAIQAAKERIYEIYNNKKQNCEKIPIVIKKCQHKYIIGQKGCVLNEIFKTTGVSIEMPTDPESEQIILRGERDKIGSALNVLYDKAHSEIDLTISAKSWIQRHLIGVKGSRLQTLQVNFPNVHVSFSADDDMIKLHGPRQETERAKQILLDEIDSVTQQYKIKEIKVDPAYHRYIIGKGGMQIKKIREQTGAQINIPNLPDANSQNSNIITIEGSDEAIAAAEHELEQIIKKAVEKETQVTKDLIIEQRFHSQLIGSKGENIKEIRDKFNVFINFPDSSVKSDKVSIRGSSAQDVEACYKHLSQLNKKLINDNYRLEMPINKQMLRFIIGKEGTNIKKIRSETDTKIDLPAEDSTSNTILISGEKSKVEKAKQMIQKIEKDELSLVQVDIIIPKKFHSSILRIVRSIQEECDNVQITFPPQSSNSDKVTIRGTKEGVNQAKKQLVELSNDKQLNNYEESLPCRYEFHKFIIGKGGVNINKIKEAHNVRLIFPKEDETDQKNEITIIGKKESVQKCKKELEAKISALEKIVEVTVNVPQKFHSHFIAKRLVNRIAEENNDVSIKFPKIDTQGPDADKVTIKGAKEFVESARAKILEIADELQQQVTHEIEIDSKYHGTVIGQRAINLVQIEQRHNVRINFPKREFTEDGKRAENRSNKVQIQGKNKEKCIKAAQDLFALVPVTSELKVPFEYHKNIIGKGGAFLRQIQEKFRVSCKMPKAEEQSDTIVLNGAPSDIEKAKQKIEDKIKELEQQKVDEEARSYTIEIKTQSSFIPRIIGKKGATINEIRKANDVNIQLSDSRASRRPRLANGGADDTMSESSITDADKSESTVDESSGSTGKGEEEATITVRGYEKNVKNAVRRINKIIKELESFVVERLHIDPENYSQLIGVKGKKIRKMIDQFKVDIKIPSDGSELVTISGIDKSVQACKAEILKSIALFDEDDDLSMYKPPKTPKFNEIEIKPASGKYVNTSNSNNAAGGFFVRDAPWDQKKSQAPVDPNNRPDTNNVDDFPSMNTTNSSETKNVVSWVSK